jgi:hypothetical protein
VIVSPVSCATQRLPHNLSQMTPLTATTRSRSSSMLDRFGFPPAMHTHPLERLSLIREVNRKAKSPSWAVSEWARAEWSPPSICPVSPVIR